MGTLLLTGDCLGLMRDMDANSVDAIVTDPPYGLAPKLDVVKLLLSWLPVGRSAGGFMGKAWDAVVPGPEIWREALRVLKPGGHALVFGGTRTYHLLVVAMQIAGFEIRDQLAWMYGSGFPKSLNGPWGGTALKPAQEPICLARKPLAGTVAANVLAHGTGGINIDACRIGTEGGTAKGSKPEGDGHGIYGAGLHGACEITKLDAGRWPANVLLDESAAEALDAQTGIMRDGVAVKRNTPKGKLSDCTSYNLPNTGIDVTYGGSGGASRFFYVAKASRSEREAGLGHLPKHSAGELTDREDGSDGLKSPRAGAGRTSAGRANNHPTVKPIALMRYLVRLITPPGGTVLDPFAGSGTTLCAAAMEHRFGLGCEMDPDYVTIAQARIAHWAK